VQSELLAVRQRLRDDFPYYTANSLSIRTKQGKIAPLVLNKAQEILIEAVEKQHQETGRVRVIVLKARQQGLSTAIGAWIYWWVTQHTAQRAIVVTHKADSTKTLFDMTRRYYDNTPAILKPSTRYASRRELFFDKLDSSYTVATAGGDSIGRSETISQAHLSELAFWPVSDARENFNGLTQAIPNEPDTAIFIESTANGVTGLFYEMWKGAVDGSNGYIAIFIPWFESDEYRSLAPADFERTPDEEELVEKFGLDNDQLKFRREKIAQNGLDLFKQEYPSTADEAFLTTGRPVFNPEKLHKILETLQEVSGGKTVDKPPLQRLALEGDEWQAHPRGELHVYKEYDEHESYTIGADTSAGIRGRDYSVATVLDRRKRQVAVLRGYFAPDYFADLLYHLGKFYNYALIGPENNNHGILTVNRLHKELAYPYVYTEVVVDKISDQETIKIGFGTNVKTKPLIIDKLRADVRDGEIELTDATTVREMLTYVVDEGGKMEAEKNCHDDCVMALAICNHIHEGNFEPVPNLDSYYTEML
jgi:hypothetical protein